MHEGFSPRALSKKETTLLAWCAGLLPKQDSIALNEQLAKCQIVHEDNGGVWFRVMSATPPIKCQGIDFAYNDLDGERVEFIIAFVAGYIEWVDRYRNDSAAIRKLIPDPAEIQSWQVVC